MRAKSSVICWLANVILLVPLYVTSAHGQFKVIHNFSDDSNDGAFPVGALTVDMHGNLYGTTNSGGANGIFGTVYELTNTNGTWNINLLHSFNFFGGGAFPFTGVILDGSGNVYGLAACGSDCNIGGSVFKIAHGSDNFSTLHIFTGGWDGKGGNNVVLGSDGRLYGNAIGGVHNAGLVFTLPTQEPEPGQNETVLYAFSGGTEGGGTEGRGPVGPLVFDAHNNIYGTVLADGTANLGTVYKLTPNGSIGWTHTVLHSFQGGSGDGSGPESGVIFDAVGNLYGTTVAGGGGGGNIACPVGCGTVFKMTPNSDGTWSEKVIYIFQGNNGIGPIGLAFDTAGNLYGTTYLGGNANNGIVFKLTPSANGPWLETILHNFSGGSDGGSPQGGVILDSVGNLYGTASAGGLGAGVVFEISGLN
jgi:uncharacterized repeat protein (TIGR03803 family)